MSVLANARAAKQSLPANAMAVLVARLLVPVLNVALVISIARIGGAASLGQYTFLITLFMLGESLKSLGLTTLLVREMSREGDGSLTQYRSLVRIGLWGAVVTAGIMVLMTACTGSHSHESIVAAIVISLGLLPSAFALANDAVFLALGRAALTMYVTFVENLLRLILSLVAVAIWHKGIVTLAAIYAVMRLFAALAQEVIIRRHLRIRWPKYDPAVTWQMLRRAPAFLMVFVAPLILFRLDVVLLGLLSGDYEVGIYSAAMRLVTVCLMVPDSILTATFAKLSQLSGEGNRLEFERLLDSIVRLLTSVLLFASAIGALLAPWIFHIIYGPKFDSAIPVMQTLCWALVPFAVNRALGDSLVACGEQKKVALIAVASIFFSVPCYALLIRRFEHRGAAFGFFFSALAFCLISAVYAIWHSKIISGTRVWLALGSAAAGLIGFEMMPSFESHVTIAIVMCVIALASAFHTSWLKAFQYQLNRRSA